MAMTFCPLASGSKGNSYLVMGDRTRLLIDAGMTAKYLEDNLRDIGVEPDTIEGIIVTHEHSDHTAAIKVLAGRYGIPVFANEPTLAQIVRHCPKLEARLFRRFVTGESFFVGELEVQPFRTPHDSASSCGFSVFYRQNKITVATDLGHMTRTVLEACKESDLLVIECNHDPEMLQNGPYTEYLKMRIAGPRGHLCNELCGKTVSYLLDYGLKQAILAHLSEDNNTPELAYQTVCALLNERGAEPGKDILLDVADQYRHGKCYRLS